MQFNIGDIVETLIEKKVKTHNIIKTCPKGMKGTVCDNSGDNYVTVDFASNGEWYTFDYGINEVKLIKKSNYK